MEKLWKSSSLSLWRHRPPEVIFSKQAIKSDLVELNIHLTLNSRNSWVAERRPSLSQKVSFYLRISFCVPLTTSKIAQAQYYSRLLAAHCKSNQWGMERVFSISTAFRLMQIYRSYCERRKPWFITRLLKLQDNSFRKVVLKDRAVDNPLSKRFLKKGVPSPRHSKRSYRHITVCKYKSFSFWCVDLYIREPFSRSSLSQQNVHFQRLKTSIIVDESARLVNYCLAEGMRRVLHVRLINWKRFAGSFRSLWVDTSLHVVCCNICINIYNPTNELFWSSVWYLEGVWVILKNWPKIN